MQLVHKIGPKYLYSSPTKFFEVNRQLPLFTPLAAEPKMMGIMTDVHIFGRGEVYFPTHPFIQMPHLDRQRWDMEEGKKR